MRACEFLRVAIPVALFAALPQSLQAEDTTGHFAVWGFGNSSCGTYLSSNEFVELERTFKGWLAGYLTAFNEFTDDVNDILQGTDFDGGEAWIKNYCLQNPTDNFRKAAGALTKFMQDKRQSAPAGTKGAGVKSTAMPPGFDPRLAGIKSTPMPPGFDPRLAGIKSTPMPPGFDPLAPSGASGPAPRKSTLMPPGFDPFAAQTAPGPKLTPVDGNPFASKQSGPKLSPVEGDPFSKTGPVPAPTPGPQAGGADAPATTGASSGGSTTPSGAQSTETVFVKYRGPVSLAPFVCDAVTRSSFIQGVCYDAKNTYMLIKLNGTYYQYCEIDPDVVAGLESAVSMGRFFGRSIKGHFDCRTHRVPNY